MAACMMCLALGKKLHQRWYMQHKLYVCTQCALSNEEMLDKEQIIGHDQDSYSRA